MRTFHGIVVAAAAALSAALLVAPEPSLGQAPLTAQEKADLKAKAFEKNATLITLYNRQGKLVNTVGERARYWSVALSPDRTRVATIQFQSAGLWDLFVLDASTGANVRITTAAGPSRVRSAVWSPDGNQIAYSAQRGATEGIYRKASTGEGPEELLYRNPGFRLNLSDWSPDGRFLAFAKSDLISGAIYVLPLAGQGERTPVEIFRSEQPVYNVRFSPDGRFVAYLTNATQTAATLLVRPFDSSAPWSGASQVLTDSARPVALDNVTTVMPFWRRDGKELYYIGRDRTVMVAEVDTTGPFQFQKPKVLFRPPGVVPVSISYASADGEQFVGLPPPQGLQLQQITVFDREGNTVSKTGMPGLYATPVFSTDGTRLAVVNSDLGTGENNIRIFDLASGEGTDLAVDENPILRPVWSPDGRRLYYVSARGSYFEIYRRAADNTGAKELVFRYTIATGFQLTDVSPDERFLAITSGGVLLTVPLTGTDPLARRAVEFAREEFGLAMARFSPDGRWIAYRSNESGQNDVYVQRFDPSTGTAASEERWHVSKSGGQGMVHWRADGNEIVYLGFREGTREPWVTAVEVATTPQLTARPAKLLFRPPDVPLPGELLGNISGDAQRFAFLVNVPGN